MASLTQWTWVWASFEFELVVDREAWCAVVCEIIESWTRLSNWTELNDVKQSIQLTVQFHKDKVISYRSCWLIVHPERNSEWKTRWGTLHFRKTGLLRYLDVYLRKNCNEPWFMHLSIHRQSTIIINWDICSLGLSVTFYWDDCTHSLAKVIYTLASLLSPPSDFLRATERLFPRPG